MKLNMKNKISNEYNLELVYLLYNDEESIFTLYLNEIVEYKRIAKYVQKNYQKHAIYENATRTRNFLKINKKINKDYFAIYDLLDLYNKYSFTLEFTELICSKINVFPNWFLKLKRINELEEKIEFENNFYKNNYNNHFYKEEDKTFCIRLIFSLFTFGLSFIGYTSKKQREVNKSLNSRIKKENSLLEKNRDEKIELLKQEINLLKEI